MTEPMIYVTPNSQMAGLGSKLKKGLKKIRKLDRKIREKTGVQKINEKTGLRKLGRKLDEKGITKMAAMAVATVVTGGAAAGGFAALAKSAAVELGKNIVVDKAKSAVAKKLQKRYVKKEEKKLRREIASLQRAQKSPPKMPVLTEAQKSYRLALSEAQDAVKTLPPAQQQYVKQQLVASGPSWLETQEAQNILRPAVAEVAGGVTYGITGDQTKATAAMVEAESKPSFFGENKWLILGGGGAALLLLLLATRGRSK